MSPKVSIVMSVYQGQPYLEEAVGSVLRQTWADFEFIIVDDGSTDETDRMLKTYAARDRRIVLVRNDTNAGLTKSLNRALPLARGTYVARQDADDISMPRRIETQVEFLDSHPHVGLLGSAYQVINVKGEPIASYVHPPTDTEIRWHMLFHNAFCHSSVMWRRRLVNEGEPWYEEDQHYSQDYGLWTRLLKQTAAANLDVPLVAYRTHGASIESTSRETQQRIALSIAAREIQTLLEPEAVNNSDVQSLRDWYNRWPEQIRCPDYGLCLFYLRILSAFARQKSVGRAAGTQVRRAAMGRVLASLSFSSFRELWRAGLVGALLRLDGPFVMNYLLKQRWLHIKRGFRPYIPYQFKRHTRNGI